MKNKLCIAISAIGVLLCMATKLQSQNLVLNPDFSLSSACPTTISQFYLTTNWSNVCNPPEEDSCSSPDLFATCAGTVGGVNVPDAIDGYHTTYSGSHMAGLILGDGAPGCLVLGDNYREYIEGTLSTPMVAGNNYLVEFYVSLASGGMWGSNSFGVYLSSSLYTHADCPTPLLSMTPQLEECGPPIMNTVDWIPIQWIYTATGGEQYFIIGNFHDDANTNHTVLNCSSNNAFIYYYIGYVNVQPVGPNDCGVTLITDSVNTTCGANNGRVSITAIGCPTPFTYAWSSGGTDTAVENLPAGTYTVTVTDALNCHETVSVGVNSIPLAATISGNNPSCGSNNGSAVINITNQASSYTYSWSNGASTQTISNLSAGTFYATVTGAQNCIAVDSISLLGASGLTLTPNVTPATCSSSNGSATITASGGTPPYSYSWSNGGTTQTISGLTAGTYSVTVAGDTGSSAPFWTENFSSGGTGWTLNTPGTGTNGLYANQWIVNSDANCQCSTGNYLHITCNSASFFCLTQPGTCTYLEIPPTSGTGKYQTDELAISPVISTVGKSNIILTFTWESYGVPGSDYGLVDVSSDGGTTWTQLPTQYVDSQSCSHASVAIPNAYQNIADFRLAFEWLNGPGSVNNSGNAPGFAVSNIALTTTSSNCPATTSVTVGTTSGLTLQMNPTSPTCGLDNGSVTADITSGTGPYTYSWNNGGTAETINNLAAGLYTVTASNSSGCSVTGSAALSIANGAISAVLSPVNTSCGSNNGSAAVTVSPSGTYSYSWSNNATTSSITGLTPGNYSVTVTAGAGCTATASTVIDTSSVLTITAYGGRAGCTSSGTATVDINTGTGPFTYLWNNNATASSINSLSAGNYSVTVTGAAGCSASATVTVISTGTGVTLTASSTPSGCSSTTGTLSVDATTGDSPFTYSWSNGATAATVSNVAGGTYTVTVIASGGCSATASVTVTTTGGLSLTTMAVGTSCGNSNGSASVNAGSGTFTYSWSNNATSDSISNLAAGTYTVTVQNTSGCSATASAIVNPSGGGISIQAQPAAICQGDTSQICAPVGYQAYLWNHGQTSACISVTQAGTYYVTVTDNANCTATSNHVTVTVNVADTVSITQHGDSLIAGAASSYQWYFNGAPITGATSGFYIPQQNGNYYVKTTDHNNCTSNSRTEVVTTVLGINQLSANSTIKVYPNPLASGNWHLDVSLDWIGSYCEVYDDAGRLVFKTQIKNTQSEFEMDIAQGVYLMRVNSGEKNYALKLIKL